MTDVDTSGSDSVVDEAPRAPRSRRHLRRLIGVLVVVLLIFAAVLGWVGWHFSSVAMEVSHDVVYDTVASPQQSTSQIALPPDPYSTLPGRYGLAWPGGYGTIGRVVSRDERTVIREFTAQVGQLTEPMAARTEANAFVGNPKTAQGLDFSQVAVDGESGALPAWLVPPQDGVVQDRTWVIFVHGRGADRREGLRYLPIWHAAGLPSLVVSYRNDLAAPPSPDGRNHLGDNEWRDVDAAIDYALGQGARDIILAGWSQGGAVSLQTADRTAHPEAIRALILDSPVVDWRDVFVYQGGEMGLPSFMSRFAGWTMERRIGIDLDRFDWVERADELTRPMLVFAPSGDTYVPSGPAQELGRARPDLITLYDYDGADHVRSWNVDPERYERDTTAWLTKLLEDA